MLKVAPMTAFLAYIVRYFINKIMDEISLEIKKLREQLKTTTLDDDIILTIAKGKVWIASKAKLDYIEKRLRKNNIYERQDIIKRQIRAELERISKEEYLDYLNWFSFSWWLVWDWVWKNFPMDDFVEELFDVIFHVYEWSEKEIISKKMRQCQDLMIAYQSELWNKFKINP